MSVYFSGKAASLAANEKAPKIKPLAPKPKAPPKPKKVALPPILGGPGAFKPTPKTVHAFQKANPVPKKTKAAPVRQPRPGGSAQPGLPKDYGNPAKLMNPRDKATLVRVGKNPHIQNIAGILGDPAGVAPSIQSLVKFGQNPTLATGLGAGFAAAGLLPFGKGLKGAKILEDVGKAEAPDAGAVLRSALSGNSEKAALKGMGKYEKAGAQIDNPNLGKSARQLRKQIGVGYSAERGNRSAQLDAIYRDTTKSVAEREHAADAVLRGALPTISHMGLKKDLTPDVLDGLKSEVMEHPELRNFEKKTLLGALTRASQGTVPTNSELDLIERTFGKDTSSSLAAFAKEPNKWKQLFWSAVNVPRSIMSTADLSNPFRQSLAVATSHPKIFFKNFLPMVKAAGSEASYHGLTEGIRARPTYPYMVQGGLDITDLGKDVARREEQMPSDIAEKLTLRSIPGVNKVPGLGGKFGTGPGDIVRGSGRAYTGYSDVNRADVFDHLLSRYQSDSRGVLGHLTFRPKTPGVVDDKFLKDLSRYVNTATGRGPLWHFQGAAKALNAFFFSPKLMASRLDLLFSPITYARADPFVRKQAIQSMLQLAGTASVLLGVASQIPGAKVVTDPRNPDWGKIRIGNTRIDIGGGFQQYLRIFAQIGSGVAISSTTGKRLNLTAGGFGQPNRLDLALRFFEGKESPWASLATDWMRNSNQVGQKFSWKNEASSRMLPLLYQDSKDLYNAHHGGKDGLLAAFLGYGVGSVGFGIQTYGPRPTKPKSSGLTGPSPYFGGSQSSGSSPYFNGP